MLVMTTKRKLRKKWKETKDKIRNDSEEEGNVMGDNRAEHINESRHVHTEARRRVMSP